MTARVDLYRSDQRGEIGYHMTHRVGMLEPRHHYGFGFVFHHRARQDQRRSRRAGVEVDRPHHPVPEPVGHLMNIHAVAVHVFADQ
ncbi:hypothetical protein AB0M34_08725 [Nocardia sp. NPDC050193]